MEMMLIRGMEDGTDAGGLGLSTDVFLWPYKVC